MGFSHSVARLKQEMDCLLDRQTAMPSKPPMEVCAYEVLHHHVRNTGVQGAHVEDADNVIALDERRQED